MAQAKLKSKTALTAQPTVQPKTTLTQCKGLADTAVKNLEAAYGELGTVLIDAEIDLGKQEYLELTIHLKHQGISAAQIQCARGVAQKRIDSSLVFYADKQLRMPAMPMVVQKTLRTKEHPLKQPDGTIENKKWEAMKTAERFQLVGPTYSRIIPPEEQLLKTPYGPNSSKHVHFDGESLVIARSTVPVQELVDKLRSEGQLDAFVALINRMAKSKEKKSA
jgi:hypothetical protein